MVQKSQTFLIITFMGVKMLTVTVDSACTYKIVCSPFITLLSPNDWLTDNNNNNNNNNKGDDSPKVPSCYAFNSMCCIGLVP